MLTTLGTLLLGTPDVGAQLRVASELEEVIRRRSQTPGTGQHATYGRRVGPTESIVLRHRGVVALQVGDRTTFDHNHRELRTVAAANHDSDWHVGAIATMWDGLVALMEGRVKPARLLVDRLLDASHGDPNLVSSYGAQMFQLRRDQGRIAEVLPPLEEFAATTEQLDVARALLALAHTELGHDADARRIFDALAAAGFTQLTRDSSWSFVLAVLSELCWHLRDHERAAVLQQLCEPYAGQLVVLAWGVCCLGAMDRYCGMLADVLDQTYIADRRFADAAALENRVGAIVPLTRTRLAWAASIRRIDEQRAHRLLSQAITSATDLGLDGLQIAIAQTQHALATPLED